MGLLLLACTSKLAGTLIKLAYLAASGSAVLLSSALVTACEDCTGGMRPQGHVANTITA